MGGGVSLETRLRLAHSVSQRSGKVIWAGSKGYGTCPHPGVVSVGSVDANSCHGRRVHGRAIAVPIEGRRTDAENFGRICAGNSCSTNTTLLLVTAHALQEKREGKTVTADMRPEKRRKPRGNTGLLMRESTRRPVPRRKTYCS